MLLPAVRLLLLRLLGRLLARPGRLLGLLLGIGLLRGLLLARPRRLLRWLLLIRRLPVSGILLWWPTLLRGWLLRGWLLLRARLAVRRLLAVPRVPLPWVVALVAAVRVRHRRRSSTESGLCGPDQTTHRGRSVADLRPELDHAAPDGANRAVCRRPDRRIAPEHLVQLIEYVDDLAAPAHEIARGQFLAVRLGRGKHLFE